MGRKSQLKAQRRAEKIVAKIDEIQKQKEWMEILNAPKIHRDYRHLPVVKTFGSKSIFQKDNEKRRFVVSDDVIYDVSSPFEKFIIAWDDHPGGSYVVIKNRGNCYRCVHTFWAFFSQDAKEPVYLYDDPFYIIFEVIDDVRIFTELHTRSPFYDTMTDDYASVVIKTLQLMNAENIELIEKTPDLRLSQRHEANFKTPMISYKVLKVNTNHIRYQGRDKNTGLKDLDFRRMHVVRGHHAEYGKNGRGLLFGKYERKVWIPAHVRGNEEVGTVVKDYEVIQ